jgi:valyl-tRNA synthetase
MGDTAIWFIRMTNDTNTSMESLHVPLINRRIPIITDEYVTMEFGTGIKSDTCPFKR